MVDAEKGRFSAALWVIEVSAVCRHRCMDLPFINRARPLAADLAKTGSRSYGSADAFTLSERIVKDVLERTDTLIVSQEELSSRIRLEHL